jgi:thioredoxin 1
MIEVNDENFVDVVLKANYRKYDIVVVEVYTDTCGPCKPIMAYIKSIESEYPNILFCKVDGDDSLDVVNTYNVLHVPTLLIFKDGKCLKAVTPSKTKDVDAILLYFT